MDAILERRSIRKYVSKAIPDEDVHYLLEAGMSAPSAGNGRPWHFVVIRDRVLLNEIPSFHPYAQMLFDAPMAILVCFEEKRETRKGYWVQDCAAATENILIAARSKGLGSVWLGVYPREERVEGLKKLVRLPAGVIPFSLIALGYPGEEKPFVSRYDEERVHYNIW